MSSLENIDTLKVLIKQACTQTQKEAGIFDLFKRVRLPKGVFKGNTAPYLAKIKSQGKQITALRDSAGVLKNKLRKRTALGLGLGAGSFVGGSYFTKRKAEGKAREMGEALQQSIANMSLAERLRLSAGLMFKPRQVGSGINAQIQQLMNNL